MGIDLHSPTSRYPALLPQFPVANLPTTPLPNEIIPAPPRPTFRHPLSGPVPAPECPRSPPDTHEFAQNTQEFADFIGFSRRRRDATNSTLPAVDRLPDGLLHAGDEKKGGFGGIDPGPWTCDQADPFLRRRTSREPGAGRQKSAKNAAFLHTFLRTARCAARLPKYARIVAL